MDYVKAMRLEYGEEISEVPLVEKQTEFLDHISKEFKRSSAAMYRAVTKAVITNASCERYKIWDTYASLFEHYSTNNAHYVVRVMLYDLFDLQIPAETQVLRKKFYYELNDHFREVVHYYLALKKKAGTDSSLRRVSLISAFFVWLQGHGKGTIQEIGHNDIMVFAQEMRWDNSTYKKMANQIADCEPLFGDGACMRVASLFPKQAGKKHINKGLSEEELEVIKKGLFSPSKLTPFERSCGMLLFLTGCRGIDVRNLKCSDIDWKGNKITIIQQKTKRPVSWPLPHVLADTMLDYYHNCRPGTDSEYFFVFVGRFGRITQVNAHTLLGGIFKKLGIEMGDDRHAGSRIVRHAVASKLLREGESRATIASILGHTYPSAINPYIDIEDEKLRCCALDISAYPVQSRLYSNDYDSDGNQLSLFEL